MKEVRKNVSSLSQSEKKLNKKVREKRQRRFSKTLTSKDL
jgi:hypothetical protein|tara:strand:+ start:903 stop:1022 length:120 start_codon:yes stop_codon:yes gene_type:complete